MTFVFWVVIKQMKNKTLVHLKSLNHRVKTNGCFYEHKFLELSD